MSQKTNLGIAQELLAGIAERKDPGLIAALFSENVLFEIAGDIGALPWIGRKTGRAGVAEFIRELRAITEPLKFDIQHILASDARAGNRRRLAPAPLSSRTQPRFLRMVVRDLLFAALPQRVCRKVLRVPVPGSEGARLLGSTVTQSRALADSSLQS